MSIRIGNQTIATNAGAIDADNKTIIKDKDVISVIGVQTKSDTLMYNWEGTLAEWELGRARGTIPDDWYCYVTDDYEEVSGVKRATVDLDNLTPSGQAVINNWYETFCVNSGSVDENGRPNFVTETANKSDGTLTYRATVPFVYTTARGLTYHVEDQDDVTDLVVKLAAHAGTTKLLCIYYDNILKKHCMTLAYHTARYQASIPTGITVTQPLVAGVLWLNTSIQPELAYVYDGTNWVETDCVPVATVTFPTAI
jgi:hypothetical protein